AILIPTVYPVFAPLNPVSLPEFEVVWAQVLLFRSWVRFGVVYRPPVHSELMPACLIDYLTSVLDLSIPTILVGDFNYPDIDWISGKASASNGQRLFFHFTITAGLDQLIRFPTRNDKILDLVFVTEPNLVQCLELGPKFEFCDHETLMGSLVCQIPKAISTKYHDFLRADYFSIEQHLLFVR
ncbi:MAG: hypothetical protein GY858_07420, partial [Candidatus Omnitrophica bacterium]|nr:hypothetical protein [Candidatus Omnitrophota bacterium]